MTIPLRSLGSLDLQVPMLGFGGAPVGRLETVDQAIPVIERAYAQGIRFFDTAPLYGAGKSETYLGQALRDKPRDSFALATKVGRLVQTYGQDVHFDFSYDGIMRSVDESLARLQLDAVDILHIHDPDDHIDVAGTEAYRALDSLRDQKIIRGAGIGMNRWELGERLMRHGHFDCFLLAGRYTLLHQDGLQFINRCQAEGIGIILGGVYNSGILATGNVEGAQYSYRLAPPAIRRHVARLETVCRSYDVSLAAAALQMGLMHPGVSCAVIGAEATSQVDRNLENLGRDIPSAFWARLRREGLLDSGAPVQALDMV